VINYSDMRDFNDFLMKVISFVFYAGRFFDSFSY